MAELATDSTTHKAQLDDLERERLEGVVTRMRQSAERDVRYRVEVLYGLKKRDGVPASTDAEAIEQRKALVAAIDREAAGGKPWAKARDLYIKSVGYTLVNRLTGLRCLEVRGFIDRAVTRFRDDGITPAADPLIEDEFYDQQEGVWEAYQRACQRMADEIEILFDLHSPYSLVPPAFETFEALCRMLDEVDDAAWRADDVLGWVYEYYNVPDLEAVRQKARTKGLDAEDVPIANQFYTPTWVVRMLTDNSLGKLYLEKKGALHDTIEAQKAFTIEQRKQRSASPREAPTLTELCTYLVATEQGGEATDFDGPSEIRVFDPACGSAHFLLYAFDILERIWWDMRPDLSRAEIPSLILQHNLFGADLDLRACQLAAFNLYLKARTRAEEEGATAFHLPTVGIVCSDPHVADLAQTEEVFDEVAAGNDGLREALSGVVRAFEQTEGLGSLLDVRGTLKTLLRQSEVPLFESEGDLNDVLAELQRRVAQRGGGSFRADDLRSFVRLLVVLTQRYDVTLMNPPYGGRNRMPTPVQEYVEAHYRYEPEFYINFFEVCTRVSKKNGRVGMLVPRSFMFKRSFESFRQEFISGSGAFDFLAELGLGVLDRATVRSAVTVVRAGEQRQDGAVGDFFRLHDVAKEKKEETYLRAAFVSTEVDGIERRFSIRLSDFNSIPGAPLSYWVPTKLRDIYKSEIVFDAANAGVSRQSIGEVKEGLTSGDNPRFFRRFWEVDMGSAEWRPLAKGGKEAWMLPNLNLAINWKHEGEEVARYSGSYIRNPDSYYREALTYTYLKEGGRRFGYINEGSVFDHAGKMFIPYEDVDIWSVLAYANSSLATYLVLAQTPERHWEVGVISKLPWLSGVGDLGLNYLAQEAVGIVLSLRQYNFASPYYIAPILLSSTGHASKLSIFSKHPFRDVLEPIALSDREFEGSTLAELANHGQHHRNALSKRLIELEREIDLSFFRSLGLEDQFQNVIYSEINLRTNDDPGTRTAVEVESDIEVSADLPYLVQCMLLHLVMEIVYEDDDGVVLLNAESAEEEASLLVRLEAKFKAFFGEHAAERLAEADQLLGRAAPGEDPYPNLRRWLEKDLFGFHTSEFENTPILWKLTTGRLTSGTSVEAFACLVDYHRLDVGIFDRIRTRYLERRKSALRQKRDASRQRSGDTGLGGSDRTKAQEELERCTDALTQIGEFEQALSDLSRSRPRDWTTEDQALARELAPTVRAYHERLQERLSKLDRLHEVTTSDWFTSHFSDKFMEKVEGKRAEWLDALEDLEAACEQYAQPADRPVEAHLYDLFVYVPAKVLGSTHYSSGGSLFLNYYFKKGKKLADTMSGKSLDRLSEAERLVVELARETEEDARLGKEIAAACKKLEKRIESDWKTRALEEITTAGYRPVKKHGVAINITPLAEKQIVPAIVDDKVAA